MRRLREAVNHLGYRFVGWFLLERTFQSQQRKNSNERILTLTLSLLRNLPCGALERREFSESKVTLGNSFLLDERESQYDIGVGSTNETKKFSFSFGTDSSMASALRREHEQEFCLEKSHISSPHS